MPFMSSPSVCHSLQSCLEPLRTSTEEIKPQIHIWVRSASVSSDYPDSVFKGYCGIIHERNSVSFLCNPVHEGTPPPHAAYAMQALRRNRNLEMCTETLGSETGAMYSAYELEIAAVTKKTPPPLSKLDGSKWRSVPTPEFPPPLTTLSGECRLRLGRKQEEGRLLLIPFKPFILEAERSGGRLLLRFLPSGAVKETEKEKEVEEEEKDDSVGKDEDGGKEMECFVYGSGGKYRRSGRCKEEGGGQGRAKMSAAPIFNRDAFWVASS